MLVLFMVMIMVMLVLFMVVIVVMVLMFMFLLILRMTCLCKHLHLKVILSFHNLKNLLAADRVPIGCNDCCIRIQLLDLLYTELQLLRCCILAAA